MSALEEARARLRVEVASAARLIAPVWPVERFIAVNPLHGLVEVGFDGAVDQARRWLRATGYPGRDDLRDALADGRIDLDDVRAVLREQLPLLCASAGAAVGAGAVAALDVLVADLVHGIDLPDPDHAPRTAAERFDAIHGTALAVTVDAEVSRWSALLTQPSHGPLGFPDRHLGAYPAWRGVAVHDRHLRRLVGRAGVAELGSLPDRADDAIDLALRRLGIKPADRAQELRGQLARVPGWAGFARWCDEWSSDQDPVQLLGLLDLLAIRLSCESLAIDRATRSVPDSAAAPVAPAPPISTARQRATSALASLGVAEPDPATVAWAGDVLSALSDGRRGQLVLAALELGHRRELLTTLGPAPAVGPAHVAVQAVFCIDGRSEGLRRHLEATGPYDTFGFAGFFAAAMRHRPLGSNESYPSAPVLLSPAVEVCETPTPGAEAVAGRRLDRQRRSAATAGTVDAMAHGPLAMFALAEAAGWVLGPAAMLKTIRPRPRARVVADGTRMAIDPADGSGFSLEDRTLVAETALRTMGLTTGFAPVVLLCGHGATTTANPHAASLDCGACGGNRGGPNARTAAAICNDPAVRSELRGRGIDIPATTWFIAGEHDTTTDEVVLYDLDRVPVEHRAAVEDLASDLAVAGERNAAERLARLPGRTRTRSARHSVQARAGDWAQTRPEWGLARNAAFIVGPRDLTRGVPLDGRVFLHSYDADADVDGTALETILTAPMVVAHWINAQYYFSTVDPDLYGAGDKTLHNPVSGIGVLVGTGGDLRGGLPRQSVMVGDRREHEPLRLLVIAQAPRTRIDEVVARNPILRHLFDGAWVRLTARDRVDGPWHHWTPGQGWQLDSDQSNRARLEEVPA